MVIQRSIIILVFVVTYQDLQVMKDEHRRLLSMMTESENSQKVT